MLLIEKDCKIQYESPGVFILYLLKNKKELKEDSEDSFKFGGCYVNLDNAFKEVVRFRKDKKT